jgi:carbon-monoxide dehydrogenase large subunit
MSTGSAIGDTPRRREDQRFLTGHGATLDDLAFPGCAHAVALRSPHAHAEIRAIDDAAARTLPGVLAILTHAEADADA